MDTVHEEALAAAGVRADGTIDINARRGNPTESAAEKKTPTYAVPRKGKS